MFHFVDYFKIYWKKLEVELHKTDT